MLGLQTEWGFRVLQHKCAKEFDRVKHLERGPADLAPRAFPTLNQADENRSEKKKYCVPGPSGYGYFGPLDTKTTVNPSRPLATPVPRDFYIIPCWYIVYYSFE